MVALVKNCPTVFYQDFALHLQFPPPPPPHTYMKLRSI